MGLLFPLGLLFPRFECGVDIGGGFGGSDGLFEGAAVGAVDGLAEPTDLLADAEEGVAVVAELAHEVVVGADDGEFV